MDREMLCDIEMAMKSFEVMKISRNRKRFVLIHHYCTKDVGKQKCNAEYCLMNHLPLILRKVLCVRIALHLVGVLV